MTENRSHYRKPGKAEQVRDDESEAVTRTKNERANDDFVAAMGKAGIVPMAPKSDEQDERYIPVRNAR